ncbi:MAG: glyoxylate/hydroxypyruvate reductase A [Caldimonas sp.]
MVKLTCFLADGSAAAWATDLAAALPEANVDVWQEGDPPADYAIVWKPTQAFLDAQTALKAVFNAGAGVDALARLDLPKSVPLVRLEDAGMSEQMCDYVLHAVLHHYRELDVYGAQAEQATWAPRPPRRKADYPVGILGHGVLGRAVAAVLASAGFDVVAWARTPRPDARIRVYVGEAQRREFFGAARIVVCLLPLTAVTRHVLNKAAFADMQRGGYVINVARGAHLDPAALVEALDAGLLEGATLDVFEDEPLPADHPFWNHPKVRVTPHISATTLRREAVEQIAAKLRALERGEPVTGVVGAERGY